MELKDEFEVPLPIAEAWAVLTDFEKILPLRAGSRAPGSGRRRATGRDEVQGRDGHGFLPVRRPFRVARRRRIHTPC